jgi:ABC-type nitrate/sulfonate/bicarbonate transport system ATPase subunit
VRLVGVHKSYRPAPVVLSGVDLDLEPGVPVVLGGPNGSGKSTLLRIAAGCDTPTAGTVVDRPDVVGYLPDRFPALLRLPARRYLRHLAAVHGADREASEQASEEILDELGFTGEDDEPMAALSKGNAQKVGLAQALSCDAELLVLDEPWSGLDVDAVDALTARLSAVDVPMLLTDHTGEADSLAGVRIVHLGTDGRLDAPAGPAAPAGRPRCVRVELTCRADPRAVLDRLPPARVEALGPGRMTVHLEPRHSDAWLAAALAAGCSVRSVTREGA